jgi:hypothetical protein
VVEVTSQSHVQALGPQEVFEGPLFILSDIDGTLVPHPYFSGMASSQRARYVERVASLFSDERFGLLTGRGLTSFERLLSDANLSRALRPHFLGLEFGAHLYAGQANLFQSPVASGVHAVLNAIGEAFGQMVLKNPNLAPKDDLLTRMAQGRMEGFVLEPKALIGQVEWFYPDALTQEAFGHFLSEVVNPLVLNQPDVALQVFPSRIDVLQRGFVPKAGFLERLPSSLLGNGPAPHVIALGDELYDSYMFRYLREVHAQGLSETTAGVPRKSPGKSPFASVRCYSVGRELAFTDGRFASIEEALTQVETWLDADAP